MYAGMRQFVLCNQQTVALRVDNSKSTVTTNDQQIGSIRNYNTHLASIIFSIHRFLLDLS